MSKKKRVDKTQLLQDILDKKKKSYTLGEIFNFVPMDGICGYFSASVGEYELAFEPCYSGFCVGLYKGDTMAIKKACTQLKKINLKKATTEAMNIAMAILIEEGILQEPNSK